MTPGVSNNNTLAARAMEAGWNQLSFRDSLPGWRVRVRMVSVGDIESLPAPL